MRKDGKKQRSSSPEKTRLHSSPQQMNRRIECSFFSIANIMNLFMACVVIVSENCSFSDEINYNKLRFFLSDIFSRFWQLPTRSKNEDMQWDSQRIKRSRRMLSGIRGNKYFECKQWTSNSKRPIDRPIIASITNQVQTMDNFITTRTTHWEGKREDTEETQFN